MKRTQDHKDRRLQNSDGGHHAQSVAVASDGRPAKVARIDAAPQRDVTEIGPHCPDQTFIHALTDDALYHLFNGMCVAGAPIFPPECRWVPALVCRRWRAVVASITHATHEPLPVGCVTPFGMRRRRKRCITIHLCGRRVWL
ncbi:hypothetical protein TW95_gp0753 [Pandoravirus inopinatum]|uniref:F-box domain protein n=1 Tax=Pandoravirus inopinatum TaxID=1605721 RepID=A0A0B5JCU4_9VIRU|nr:hypothetical protein TW95_gp0753 [Pandoravirus inopinatum]AJF97487.1 hypothetical protein [Pandoravirus inopinatum]